MSSIFKIGPQGAPIIVVTDWTTSSAIRKGQHMPDNHQSYFIRKVREAGLSMSDCIFINPCPMNDEWQANKKPPTAKQHKEWVANFSTEFWHKMNQVSEDAKCVLVLGKSAAMQVFGKPTAVTKIRGSFNTVATLPCPVIATLSPAHVMSRPELARDFETDLRMVQAFQAKRWKGNPTAKMQGTYELCTDLSDWVKNPPLAIAVDTETTGLEWARDAAIITIQMTAEEGTARVIPINRTMFPEISKTTRTKLLGQVREILGNPKVKVFGHNFKFDYHMLSLYKIKVANWWMDTLQLAFSADENMQSKSLSECVRRWVPAMSGYSDKFDAETDKSNMLGCDRDELIKYGGGDTDATFRLCKVLCEEVRNDKLQWANVTKIQMPSLRMFFEMEKQGMMIDQTRLRDLAVVIAQQAYEVESRLLKMVPKAVKQKHFDQGLSFGRKAFLQDILFSKEGFGLKPTKKVADGSPATDATHLSGFSHHPFVQAYTEYQQVQKMRSTYVGLESNVVAKEVKLLKNGGWPVAVKRITNHEPEELQKFAKLESVEYFDEDGDQLQVDRITEWDDSKQCIGRNENGFYIISQSTPTGFWKHIMPDGKVHPNFFLDKTVTGRSSCVHADTIIPTHRGDKRIKDITPEDYVWTHANRWQRVEQGFVKPVQEMFEVSFSTGYVLKCTEDHLLLTDDGKWVSLRNVYIKETHGGPETIEESSISLSRIIANYAAGCGRVSHIASHGYGDSEKGRTCGASNQVEGTEILSVEVRSQEPNEGQDGEAASSVAGGLLGWQGLPNHTSEWKTTFRAPGSNAPVSRGEYTCEIGCSSHRRESIEQSPGQSSTLHKGGPFCDSSDNEEGAGRVTIKGIKPCGSYPVYDIQVAVDHSYLTAGCFSHNSKNPNFQNLPKRGALAKPFRKIFVPSIKGNVIVECDQSQAELRFAACESLDPVMMKTYRDGGDIHALTASKVSGVHLSKVTPEMRQKAKAVNFGLLYLMGVDSFIIYARANYGVIFTKDEAEVIKNTYFATYQNLGKWHNRRKGEVRMNAQVRGLLGALRRLPHINSSDRGVQAEAERQSVNSPIQRVASDVTLICMRQFTNGCPKWILPLGTIHDSGVLECPADKAEEVAGWIKWCFINPPLKRLFGVTLPIPLGADVAVGPDLGSMSELKNVLAVKPHWIA